MKIELIQYTNEPDKTVALAARRCYSSLSVESLKKTLNDVECKRLIELLKSRRHLSPFEHINFTFSIEGVSRSLSHQLVRHRIASYSQESQRYVKYENIDSIKPPEIKGKAADIFNECTENCIKTYKHLIDLGVKPEDARYVLPNSSPTRLVFTMNARSLFGFFEQRCCLKAQWEIRKLAFLMLSECKKVTEFIFSECGMTCKRSKDPYCIENNTSCPSFP